MFTRSSNAIPRYRRNGVVQALPSFPYAWKKCRCERILGESEAAGAFGLTIIRPAFTYNETLESWDEQLRRRTYHLDRLRKGLPFIVHGDGNGVWTATHRDDVARSFVAAVGNRATFGQGYNVMGGEWMTHNQILRTIARLLKAPEPDFVYIPTDLLHQLAPKEAEWCLENFRHNDIFDNSKAIRDLAFRYTVPFDEGAARSIDYLVRNDKIEDCAKYPFYDRIVDIWRRHTSNMTEHMRGARA